MFLDTNLNSNNMEEIKASCKTCSLSTEFEDKSYQDEVWCDFHQQPKFNDDICDTYIKNNESWKK